MFVFIYCIYIYTYIYVFNFGIYSFQVRTQDSQIVKGIKEKPMKIGEKMRIPQTENKKKRRKRKLNGPYESANCVLYQMFAQRQ